MSRTALLFFVMALVAAVLAMLRTEMLSSTIAWILFILFYILAVLSAALLRTGEQQMD